jgi:hypothetical protein
VDNLHNNKHDLSIGILWLLIVILQSESQYFFLQVPINPLGKINRYRPTFFDRIEQVLEMG